MPRRTFFLILFSVQLFWVIVSLVLQPARSYRTDESSKLVEEVIMQEEGLDSGFFDGSQFAVSKEEKTRLLGQFSGGRYAEKSRKSRDHYSKPNSSSNEFSSVDLDVVKSPRPLHRIKFPNLTALKFREQVRSPVYWWMVAWMVIMNTRYSVYIGTATQSVYDLGDSDSYMQMAFGWILPAGFVSVPFVAFVLRKYGLAASCLVGVIMGLVWGIFASIPVLKVQWVTFVFVALGRPWIYGSFYAGMGSIFGFKTYGRLTGIIMLLAGLGANIQIPLGYAMQKLASHPYWTVNLGLLIASLPLIYLPFALINAAKKNRGGLDLDYGEEEVLSVPERFASKKREKGVEGRDGGDPSGRILSTPAMHIVDDESFYVGAESSPLAYSVHTGEALDELELHGVSTVRNFGAVKVDE